MTSAPPVPLVVDAIGVRVGIDLSALTTVDRDTVARAWRDATVDPTTPPDVVVAPTSSDREGQTLSDLSSTVTHAAIRARRGDLWMLHAAGLAAADGGVVVLVGRSGAGKTTATRVLARSWGYVSDETVGIEPGGRVHAYRKPLSVITAGKSYKVQHAPTELGLLPLPPAPLRVRRVILLDRADGRGAAHVAPVSVTEALVQLAPHSSALASMRGPLRAMTDVLSRTGGLLRAVYAEADELTALIDDVMSSDPDVVTDSVDPLEDAPARARSTMTLGVPRYRRSPVADAHPLPGGRLAVLTAEADGRGALRVLAGAAPLLWRAAADVSRDDLLHAATDGHPDEEAERAVDGILAQLVASGLLIVSG